MNEIFPTLGPWFWWTVAAALLFGELVMPGIFLLWLGFAAALTGLVDYVFGLDWRGEIASFAVLSMASVAVSWKWVTSRWQPHSDQPHLNQRHHGYVGQSLVLEHPIINGRGKVKIDETIWDVEGNDIAAGSRVTITGIEGMRLKVRAS